MRETKKKPNNPCKYWWLQATNRPLFPVTQYTTKKKVNDLENLQANERPNLSTNPQHRLYSYILRYQRFPCGDQKLYHRDPRVYSFWDPI